MRKVSQVRTASGQTAANKLDSPLYTQKHHAKIINQKSRSKVTATQSWGNSVSAKAHGGMLGDRIKVKYTYADGTKTVRYMTPEEVEYHELEYLGIPGNYSIKSRDLNRSQEFLSNPFE